MMSRSNITDIGDVVAYEEDRELMGVAIIGHDVMAVLGHSY